MVLCLAPLWSSGAKAGLRAYSLPELEEMALKTHPALKVAGAEIKKSEAELRIARQYPNPEAEGSMPAKGPGNVNLHATGYSLLRPRPSSGRDAGGKGRSPPVSASMWLTRS